MLAPRFEMGIVALGGFFVTDLVASLLLKTTMTDPVAFLLGVVGAVMAWKMYVLFIIAYTAGLGAVLMAAPPAFKGVTFFTYAESLEAFVWLFFWFFTSGVIGQSGFLTTSGYLPGYITKDEDGSWVRNPDYDPGTNTRTWSPWKGTWRPTSRYGSFTLVFVFGGLFALVLLSTTLIGFLVFVGLVAYAVWKYRARFLAIPDKTAKQALKDDIARVTDYVQNVTETADEAESWDDRWDEVWPKVHVLGNVLGAWGAASVIGVFVIWVHIMLFALAGVIYYDKIKMFVAKQRV